MSKSIFAKALESLLDETGFFSRDKWAIVLDASEAYIDGWVTDKCFPKPEELRMVVDCIKNSTVKKEPLENFEKLYGERLKNLSPIYQSETLLRNLQDLRLGEYILLPILDGFLINLKVLPFKVQEKLLFQFAEECRRHSTENLKPVSREDAEKALARLAEINGVGIEEMRRRMNKISEDAEKYSL